MKSLLSHQTNVESDVNGLARLWVVFSSLVNFVRALMSSYKSKKDFDVVRADVESSFKTAGGLLF